MNDPTSGVKKEWFMKDLPRECMWGGVEKVDEGIEYDGNVTVVSIML